MISSAVPDSRFVIAGEGADFAPYRRIMDRPDRFIVHNEYISAAKRDQLFRQASVVVLPYIEATQSGVVPVAYSYGKPVVATDTGALGEAVEDGTTGRLVPARDCGALADAVIELIKDPERCRAMGAAGRRKLDAECTPTIVARQTLEVYRRAIRERSSTSPVAIRPGRVGSFDRALAVAADEEVSL
jgi:glycosyltransferase involved in cell wall biosynthesis